jgi:hypothetical protein
LWQQNLPEEHSAQKNAGLFSRIKALAWWREAKFAL